MGQPTVHILATPPAVAVRATPTTVVAAVTVVVATGFGIRVGHYTQAVAEPRAPHPTAHERRVCSREHLLRATPRDGATAFRARPTGTRARWVAHEHRRFVVAVVGLWPRPSPVMLVTVAPPDTAGRRNGRWRSVVPGVAAWQGRGGDATTATSATVTIAVRGVVAAAATCRRLGHAKRYILRPGCASAGTGTASPAASPPVVAITCL